MLPPMPSWNGLHPLVVHFPIALLLVAPIFVVVSMVWRRHAMPIAVVGLTLMALGMVGTFLSVATGEAAEEAAERVVAAKQVLESHEELAEKARLIFLGLTLLYGVVLLVLTYSKRRSDAPRIVATVAFLVLYAGGTLVLANTAHQGGRLVHEFGVHARVAGDGTTSTPADAILPVMEHDDD